MKNIAVTLFIALCAGSVSAQIYSSKSTQITFFSETPVENISAENKLSSLILNTATNDIAVRVPIKSFIFEKALMQEHFNENYMESSKFPTATFKGVINEKVDYTKDGTTKVTAKGKMEIHGVSREETLSGTITVKGTEISLVSELTVKPADYNIEVPKIVFEKIAESILVKVNATLMPYVKK
jgi:hypothetical protein